MASSSAAGSSATPGASVQEYTIRVPKTVNKKYHVMRFTSVVNVDLTKWSNVKLERENNMKEYKGFEEEQPKFGAGSEFGRDQREEARRKKFGIITRRYKPEDQPYLLKVGGKMGKKFKGIREGGIGDNAAYYVFTHAPDGAIDAYPLQEWYNFQPIQRYKALSAEEAEEAFGKRNKMINLFSIMTRKRLRPDADDDADDGEEGKKGKKGGKKSKELKISEMDDWIDSDDGSSDDDEEGGEKDSEEEKKKKAKTKKANAAKKKKKKKGSDDEAIEESDDGDEEGREVDYISDSTESESDHGEMKQLKGVSEEDGMRKLLNSDEDSDEDSEANKSEEQHSEQDEPKEGKDGKDSKDADKKSKKKKKKPAAATTKDSKKKQPKKKGDDLAVLIDSSSELSSDSSDASESKPKVKKEGNSSKPSSNNNSRANTPTKVEGEGSKRKANTLDGSPSGPSGSVKKPRTEAGSGESSMMEDAVRRYLMRKPMTTTELLQKFKSKKTGMSSEQLVNIMTQILKKINPVKQTIKGKMYLSIKS